MQAVSKKTVSKSDLLDLYLSRCTFGYEEQNLDENPVDGDRNTTSEKLFQTQENSLSTFSVSISNPRQPRASYISQASKKKYKPVHLKVNPVKATLPSEFRIKRQILGDPLADIPLLSDNPPKFTPTGRYTEERRAAFRKVHDTGFLWPAELDLVDDFMCKHEQGFAWSDSERGRFRPDFFPPVEFPVLPHTPWVERNIPIPPGIFAEVCEIIKKKINAGVYEPSNSSYRSKWFCVLKKDGKSLRIVHSLEPLNAVTIQHSGVPPMPDHLAEQFGGRACIGTLDLYVGYDEREIAETSRDLTTFQTPLGSLRLVTLPMGWSNSVPIFHEDVIYILTPEIPEFAGCYIDDVGAKGPKSTYTNLDGSTETIPGNRGIRRFVWEHMINLNRIVQRLKYCGATCSGTKSVLCAREGMILGHRCTPEGRMAEVDRVDAIQKWVICRNISDVRAFLGTVGVLRNFIRDFAKKAHHLQKLTRKDAVFEWGPEQNESMELLKNAVRDCPAIKAIDYESEAPVILSVDSSKIAIGYILAQCDPLEPRKRFYSRFGSITLNERESRFSQPKVELYGLYRTFGALRIYLVGVRKLIVEMDARYVKGMLNNPDIIPNATLNRWIVAILTFHFDLKHVPASYHGPDGLSRRPGQPDDEEPEDPSVFEDWIDRFHGLCHMIQPDRFPSSLEQYASYPLMDQFALQVHQPGKVAVYDNCPRKNAAVKQDDKICLVQHWLENMQRPPDMNDQEFGSFIKFALQFFWHGGRLWKKDPVGEHKVFVKKEDRIRVLLECHDDIAHRGNYATRMQVQQRFWWPHYAADVHWYVRTCHICQERQTTQNLLPPTVATPAALFAKIHVDTMHMPASYGKKYLVQGRCVLTQYPEFRALAKESAKAIGDWIFEDVMCRWGTLSEIVSDNGAPFVKALDYLAKRYHINHIRISGYNSRANGVVERPHFDVRQALYKAADGDANKWVAVIYSVFWSERITPRRRMGCSPYFAVTGCHPIIPLDIIEATYLIAPPTQPLTSTELIANRAIALQKRRDRLEVLRSKVYEARIEAARRFEREHEHTIRDFDFTRGDLVLIRNTAIEKALNRKMRPRYLGPLVVLLRNKGGAYVLSELDGTVLDRPVAAFRVIPYFARSHLDLPDDLLDVAETRLGEMKNSTDSGDDIPDELDDTNEASPDD